MSWAGFAKNLVPVTLGNVVGGAVLVAGSYWFATREAPEAAEEEPALVRASEG